MSSFDTPITPGPQVVWRGRRAHGSTRILRVVRVDYDEDSSLHRYWLHDGNTTAVAAISREVEGDGAEVLAEFLEAIMSRLNAYSLESIEPVNKLAPRAA